MLIMALPIWNSMEEFKTEKTNFSRMDQNQRKYQVEIFDS